MGSWGAATIVFSANAGSVDARAVDDTLSRLGASWGRTRWLTPRPRTPEKADAMQTSDGEAASTWGVAVVPGPSACVIVTAPPLLLVEEAAPGRTRLQELAAAQRCPCVFVRLADPGLAIVEVDALGALAASGLGDPDRPLAVGDVDLTQEFARPRFRLLSVPAAVNEVLSRSSSTEAFEQLLELLAPGCPPPHLLHQSLTSHKRVPRPGARTLYFRRKPEPKTADDADLGAFSVKLTVEEDGLSFGGAMRLEGHALEAPSVEAGAPLLLAIAEWLGLPAPAVPEHGVTEPVYASIEPFSGAPRRPGMTTSVMTLGERKPVDVLLHRAVRAEYAELELRERSQGPRLLERLAPALVGPHGRHARVKKLERVELPSTVNVVVAALGDGFLAAQWKNKTSTALFEVSTAGAVRPRADTPGLVTSSCSLGPHAALAVTDPVLAASGRPRFTPDCDSRVVLVGPGEPRVIFDGAATRTRFSVTTLVGSLDGTQLALGIYGPSQVWQTLVIDAATGDEIDRAPELLNARPALWDEAGLLLRSIDRRSYADRWFRWAPLEQARAVDTLFTSGAGRAVRADGLAGCHLGAGALLKKGDLLAVRAGAQGERAALYDAATGDATELFPVDALSLAAIATDGTFAATQNDERLYLSALTPR